MLNQKKIIMNLESVFFILLLNSGVFSIGIKFLETEKCESRTDKEIIENCKAEGCCFNMSLTFVKPILKIYVKVLQYLF